MFRPWILATFLLGTWGSYGCTQGDGGLAAEPPPVTPVATTASTPEPSGEGPPEVTLVGVVHQDATRACEADTYREVWLDKHYTVGWTPLAFDEGLTTRIASLVGKVVKVTGRVGQGAPTVHSDEAAPKALGPCPEYQMRSDMVVTYEGLRIPRGHSPDFRVLELTKLEPATPLSATKVEQGVDVSLSNPFDSSLEDVRVVAHYEGCYGKPGTTTEAWRIGKLAAKSNAAAPHRFPAYLVRGEDPTRGEHRYALRSLELEATDAATPATAFVDLEVNVSSLGVSLPCEGK